MTCLLGATTNAISLIKHKLQTLNAIILNSVKSAQNEIRVEEESLIELEKAAIMGKLLVQKALRKKNQELQFKPFCLNLDDERSHNSHSSVSRYNRGGVRASVSSSRRSITIKSLSNAENPKLKSKRVHILPRGSRVMSRYFGELSGKSQTSSQEILEEEFVIDKNVEKGKSQLGDRPSELLQKWKSNNSRRSNSVFLPHSSGMKGVLRSSSNFYRREFNGVDAEYSLNTKIPQPTQDRPSNLQSLLIKRYLAKNANKSEGSLYLNSQPIKIDSRLSEQLKTEKTIKAASTTRVQHRGSLVDLSNNQTVKNRDYSASSKQLDSVRVSSKPPLRASIAEEETKRTSSFIQLAKPNSSSISQNRHHLSKGPSLVRINYTSHPDKENIHPNIEPLETSNQGYELESPTLVPKRSYKILVAQVPSNQTHQETSEEVQPKSPGLTECTLQITPSPVNEEKVATPLLADTQSTSAPHRLSRVDTSSFSPGELRNGRELTQKSEKSFMFLSNKSPDKLTPSVDKIKFWNQSGSAKDLITLQKLAPDSIQ